MPTDITETGEFVLRGDAIEAIIDPSTGGIRRIRNLATGQILCDAPSGNPPIVSDARNHSLVETRVLAVTDLHHRRYETLPPTIDVDQTDQTVDVSWETTEPAVNVTARYSLSAMGDLEIWGAVLVGADTLPPEYFTFPILPQTLPLSDDRNRDVLIYPAHSGWLIPNPLAYTHHGRYPDGLLGLSLQMMAYYTPDRGGFYLATHDPFVTQKHFQFSESEISIRHDTFDVRPGHDFELGYPVVISALTRGDWYEAVDRYRDWAIAEAPWTRRGPVATRPDDEVPRWLYEEVGLNLWGPPTSVDWSTWYRHYAGIVDTPLHITAGWDWPATRPHHVGREGWFPPRIHPANREAWEQHRVTPYMNDIFVSPAAADFSEEWEPSLVLPYQTFSFTRFSEPPILDGEVATSVQDRSVTADVPFFVCPSTDALRDLHLWRSLELCGEYGLDGMYYDISSGVGFAQRCMRAEHGHPPGAGRSIMEAYDDLNQRTHTGVIESVGKAPAQGTELIVESLIPHIDFYISRSCAGPVAALEAYRPAPEDPPGTGRELIPLFQAVYHDHGPVHQDGWSHLTPQYGEIFYWIAARITLQWGGILSLEYAINRPERFSSEDPPVTFVGWDGGQYTFDDLPELDRAKADFCNELAQARTGFGNPYLAYGRMLRPVDMGKIPTIDADYRLDYDAVIPGGRRSGTWKVPQVIQGAWLSPAGRIGIALINLHGEDSITLNLAGNLRDLWNLEAQETITAHTREQSFQAGVVAKNGDFDLDLELLPRRVMVIELETSS